MEVLAALVIGAGFLAAAGFGFTNQRSRGRAWRDAARAAGLDAVTLHSRAGWPLRLEGRRGSLSVRISSYPYFQETQTGTRITIEGVTRRIAIRALDVAGKGVRDAIATGDGQFDRSIGVSGNAATAAALLDETTREQLRGLFAHQVIHRRREAVIDMGARLETGCLFAERSMGDQPVWLASYLEDLLALAERLREPDDLVGRLIANLRADASGAVRLNNLLVLLGLPLPLETRESVLHIAVEDVDEEVRLEAAIALGAGGWEALLRIACGESSADACAARAVQALGPELPTADGRALLERTLGPERPRTLEACLESLSQRGPEQQDVIGRALSGAEGALLPVAARALGRVGTAPSIVLLREAAARWPRHSALQDAVREAVATIRSRLVGADEGQMSLAESGESGRVSVAESGHVSLPEPADEEPWR